MNIDQQALIDAASDARGNAYAPYSHFRVGAALLAKSGKVYVGCNVESISYSPTICAERVAITSAIAAGEAPGTFLAIAVVGDKSVPTTPCGVCRQLLDELAHGIPVIMAAAPEMGTGTLLLTTTDLLPHGFTFEGANREG